MPRTFWRVDEDSLNQYENDAAVAQNSDGRTQCDEADANLVSSLTDNGYHMPVIDLDFSHSYVPSSTAGHGHLYLDSPIEWDVYERLLDALLAAGVIERGFHRLSKLRGATFVRKPGVKKPKPSTDGEPF